MEREEYKRRLDVLRDARPPSDKLGLDHCNQCGLCCVISPCKLRGMPDIKKLARRLNVSTKNIARTALAMEREPGGGLEVRVRRVNEADPLSPCHLLGDDGVCTVHEDKPSGGAEFECWNSKTHTLRYVWPERELAKLQRLAR